MRGVSLQAFSAAPVFVPSPLVGERSAGRHPKLTRERGRHTLRARLWRPLSRPRYARPPSPTKRSFAALGGEGKINASSAREPS
ncbi:MAG: hypothetical protein JWQ94_1834 [Tardiphaga sp.]|jgi:hypothetical protein|nr:hypothetical protein [Tardiphaga sp.]